MLLLGLLLAGCSAVDGEGVPLGLSSRQWEALTPEQQATALQQQDDSDQLATSLAGVEDASAGARRTSDLARQARVEQRRSTGRQGDSTDCLVESGEARFSGGWQPLAPSPFSLVRGESIIVPLVPRQPRAGSLPPELEVESAESGQVLRLCLHPAPSSGAACALFAGLHRDLVNGLQRPLEIEGVVRASLRCAYTPGQPVRVMDLP